VAIEGSDKDQLVVIGEGVDSANLTCSLRKKLCHATLLSVEEVKEKKEEPEVKPKPNCICCRQPNCICCPQPNCIRCRQPNCICCPQPNCIRCRQPNCICRPQPNCIRCRQPNCICGPQPNCIRCRQPNCICCPQIPVCYQDPPFPRSCEVVCDPSPSCIIM
jgi:hypothetical protein